MKKLDMLCLSIQSSGPLLAGDPGAAVFKGEWLCAFGGGGVLSVYFFSTFCERRLGPFSALDKLFSSSCGLHVLICC